MDPDAPFVLVIDDSEDIRALLCDLLTREVPCVVRVMEGGDEAVTFLRDPREPFPCLIVLDWMLPRLNGAAVLAELLYEPDLAAIPVAVFTTAVEVTTTHPLLHALEKPRGLPELIVLARGLCNRACAALGPRGARALAKTN
jgi:CheY-like chemotaxis protein